MTDQQQKGAPARGNGHSKDFEMEFDNNGDDDVSSVDEMMFHETAFSTCVKHLEDKIHGFCTKYSDRIRLCFYALLLVLYFAYFGYCMHHRYGDEGSIVLLVVTMFLTWKIFFKILRYRGIDIGLPKFFHSFVKSNQGRRIRKKVRYSAYIVATITIAIYLAVDIFAHSFTNLQSFLGLLAMILLCFILSTRPSRVNWHPVFWSFAIQMTLAVFTLRTKFGRDMFQWLGDLFKTFFDFSDDGSAFVIGKDFKSWGLALSASGITIFINAFLSLMIYWGVIEYIVLNLGGFLAFCLETGPVESVVAAGNIFMSLTEAPLLVQRYLPIVTKSELHTIITCGFASISGGGLGLFMAMGAPANHLLTAAVISAPAALAISKLMYPETERVHLQTKEGLKIANNDQSNSLSAFSDGAIVAVSICAATWSNMLAFVSMISLLDGLVGWLGNRAGVADLTFKMICSYALYPLAYLMGVEPSDCRKIGELIGIKLFATPFISYKQLGDLIQNRKDFELYQSTYNDTTWHWRDGDIFLEASNTTLMGGILAERTEVIATYAMCGFSAFSAIGIALGAFMLLGPARKQDIVDVTVSAFIAGNVASFATGSIADSSIENDSNSNGGEASSTDVPYINCENKPEVADVSRVERRS